MRISDWSSDVCSSDLGAAGQREIPEGDRDDALAADLALQPLHEEAHGEHRLPGEADHQHDLLFDRQVLEHVQGRLLHLSRIEAAGSAADEPYHARSEEHTSELQSLMRISYAVFCLKKKRKTH